MAQLKTHKYVSSLPAVLEANSIYFVRVGTGIDMYVTNDLGTVTTYTLNNLLPAPSGVASLLHSSDGTTSWLSTEAFGLGLLQETSAASLRTTLGLVNSTTVGRLAKFGDAAGGIIQTNALAENGPNVGIGTDLPGAKLDVRQDTASNWMIRTRSETVDNSSGFRLDASKNVVLDVRDSAGVIGASISGSSATDSYIMGNLGIGITDPATALHLASEADYSPQITLERDGDTNTAPYSLIRRARGSIAARTNIAASDFLGTFIGQGYYNAGFRNAAWFGFVAGTPSGSYVPGHITFSTTNDSGVSGERMRLSSQGFFGLGTTDPAQKLDVIGNIRVGSTTADASIKASYFQSRHYTASEEDFVLISAVGGASFNSIQFGGGSAAHNTATALQFYTASTHTTLTGTERMRIDSDGNVGIGCVSGGPRLQIATGTTNSVEYNALALGTNGWGAAAGVSINFSQDMDGANNGMAAIAAVTEIGNTKGQLQFRTSASFDGGYLDSTDTRMTITGDGDVGIGIIAPKARAQVYDVDSAGRTSLFVHNATNTADSYADVRFSVSAAGMDTFAGGSVGVRRTASGNYLFLGCATGGTVPTERLIVSSAGNVGIASAAPAVTLDVNGPIAVKSYTVATVPAAATKAGQIIYVSNASGGAVLAFSDGTSWRRVTDRAVIS